MKLEFTKKQLVLCCQVLLAVIAFFLLFAPGINWGSTAISGFQVFFGYTEKGNYVSVTYSGASFGGIMTFIFMIAIIALPIVINFIKDKKIKMILNVILATLAIIVAISLFLGTTGYMFNYTFTDSRPTNLSLGAGFIVDAILFIIIAAGAALNEFVLKD